jgi:signal transduction histidine kinase
VTGGRGGRVRGIHRRVALLAGAGVVVPMAALAWAAAAVVGEQERGLGAERQARAAALAAGLDHHLQESLARLAAVPAAPGFDLDDADPAPERAALHAARVHGGQLAGVFLTDTEGHTMLEDPPGSAAAAGASEVREALRSGGPAVSRRAAGHPPRLALLVPFHDWRGVRRGLVAGVIDPALPQWMPPLLLGGAAAGGTRLLDEAGALLAGPAGGARVEEGAAVAALAGAAWRVVVSPPAAGDGAARLGRRVLLLGPALLAVALLFAWGAARSVTGPLRTLGQAAERIAGGDLAHRVPPLGADEVGALGRSLEAMRAALAESLDALRGQRSELERRVAERTRELAGLYRRTLTVQEDERRRIARELHDQTCQELVALVLRCETALAVPAPEAVRARLAEARALATATLDGVHRLIFDLRPSILDDLGLVPALRWLAERQLGPLGIAASCELEDLGGRLAPEVETALFRAVQEALSNVARHARAETVLIQLGRRGGVVELEVEDDGQGFDPATAAAPAPSGRGLGLLGMRERLELVGGRAIIESAPGQGTRVRLQVPPEAALA